MDLDFLGVFYETAQDFLDVLEDLDQYHITPLDFLGCYRIRFLDCFGKEGPLSCNQRNMVREVFHVWIASFWRMQLAYIDLVMGN